MNYGEALNSQLCFPCLLNSTKIAESFSAQEMNKNLLVCISFTTKPKLCVNYSSIYINSSNICCKNKNYSSHVYGSHHTKDAHLVSLALVMFSVKPYYILNF